MRREEAMKLIAGAGSVGNATALLRSRHRRELRAAARKSKVSVATMRKQRFSASVETSFSMLQARVTPIGLRVKE